VKGLGNYSFPKVERKPGTVVSYRGDRAVVRFRDGATFAMPAKDLLSAQIQEGGHFVMVVMRSGASISEIRIEPPPPSRTSTPTSGIGKVYLRAGRRVHTRK
jgi:hypothetical protein